MTKDLTVGSPFRCIVEFAIPVFFGMLFQQFYNMVDTFIVGRYLGLNQLAGVGATASLYFLVIGSCSGICNGFAIPISQRFGAKDETAMKKLVANSAFLSAGFALLIMLVMVLLCKPVLLRMNTPQGAFQYAYWYIVVVFAGIPCTFLYNMTAWILRALGDSRSPVYFLVGASLLNVGLDLLFILRLGLGVAGAALATVVAQGVAGLVCLVYMYRRFPVLRLNKEEWRLNGYAMRRLCAVGLPMGLQYSITAIGSVVVQSAVNSFGELAVAGVTAAQKTHALIACPMEALGATMAAYTGQNVGAGRIDRVSSGLLTAALVGMVCSVFDFVLVWAFGRQMGMLFIDSAEVEALDFSYRFLFITAAGYPLLTLVNTVRFTIQGMGYSAFAMLAGCLEMAARCFVGFVLAVRFGFGGVCLSNLLAWVAADLFLVPAFFFCRGRMKRLVGQRE